MLLTGCNSARHVPQGQFLLDQVRIEVNDSTKTIDKTELYSYLRQLPNHKMLWSAKFRLGLYNLSGQDTTKWYNRWFRKLGEAPVIYDSILMAEGENQLLRAIKNKGFLHSEISVDSSINKQGNKIKLTYKIDAGRPYIINQVSYSYSDSVVKNLLERDSSNLIIRKGNHLDLNLLDNQRELFTTILRNNGYYNFTKDLITFNADTTSGNRNVELSVFVKHRDADKGEEGINAKFIINKINVILDYDLSTEDTLEEILNADNSEYYKGINIYYAGKEYLRPSVIYENCFLIPGKEYKYSDVERTYQSFSRLSILKFINIKFEETGKLGDLSLLDAYILLTPGKSQSVSFELEGTNSEGDLGLAAAVTYSHRNIGKGSETLNTRLRGAYESLSGNLEGLIHNRYMEYSLDLGLNFPKFKAPFLSENFKRKINATSELNVAMSYQERPEYTRIISNAGWSYRWITRRNNNSFLFTPIDINYVYLPESTYDFLDQIAPDNPLLRYSYEDHFIMRMGFSFYHSNKRNVLINSLNFNPNIYTIWANMEIAGNVLFLLSEIFDHRGHVTEHPYKIFGIYYSQYLKLNSEFSYLRILNYRNSLAMRLGFGIGFPYGNSTILPFEKRFYGGGANGVRGWDVRTLGPGSFPNSNSVSDFINQCGDIRLIASIELRTKLFWVLELATFIDAGNIWTIKNYPNQPGGLFYFDKFYKQLAGAYGLGLRFDFSYFLLRFDLGMKAHNPATGAVAWPLVHPNWRRDSSFHFSIGYPF